MPIYCFSTKNGRQDKRKPVVISDETITRAGHEETEKEIFMNTIQSADVSADKLLDVRAVPEMCGCSTRHVYRPKGLQND